jgi:hypothetical protein
MKRSLDIWIVGRASEKTNIAGSLLKILVVDRDQNLASDLL